MHKSPNIRSIATLLGIAREEHESDTALIMGSQSITYGRLDMVSNQAANALASIGVGPGDRIAFVGRDSIPSTVTLFGTAKVKAVFVNINYRLTALEIEDIVIDSGARTLIVDEELDSLMVELRRKLHIRVLLLSEFALAAQVASIEKPHHVYEDDEAVVQLYTSGTTGRPKGVCLANRSFFAIASAMEQCGDSWINWTASDRSLLFVPTFHIGGLWWLIRGLAIGCMNVVLRSFDAKLILKTIPRYRISKTCMVPSMMRILLMEPDCIATDFSSLKTVVYGGSPGSADLLEKAAEVFNCEFCQIYGMTETGNMAVALRASDHMALDSSQPLPAGKPLPGVEIRILGPNGGEVEFGGMGQVAIRSPARMTGYWNLPEATESTVVDGWVLTGDAGWISEEGFLFVFDRMKDMIIAAGENIYPAEIENAIRRHPSIADVAVIGVPDPLWGESVKALVVLTEGASLTSAELFSFLRKSLAEFKLPRSLEQRDGLPRNASGKVLKWKLREPYWKEYQRRVN